MKIEHVAVALGHYPHPLCYQTTITMGPLAVLLAIGQNSNGPLPQATNCQGVTVSHPAQPLVTQHWAPPTSNRQGVTISHPAQPLVSTAVGPSHKQPTVRCDR